MVEPIDARLQLGFKISWVEALWIGGPRFSRWVSSFRTSNDVCDVLEGLDALEEDMASTGTWVYRRPANSAIWGELAARLTRPRTPLRGAGKVASHSSTVYI